MKFVSRFVGSLRRKNEEEQLFVPVLYRDNKVISQTGCTLLPEGPRNLVLIPSFPTCTQRRRVKSSLQDVFERRTSIFCSCSPRFLGKRAGQPSITSFAPSRCIKRMKASHPIDERHSGVADKRRCEILINMSVEFSGSERFH